MAERKAEKRSNNEVEIVITTRAEGGLPGQEERKRWADEAYAFIQRERERIEPDPLYIDETYEWKKSRTARDLENFLKGKI